MQIGDLVIATRINSIGIITNIIFSSCTRYFIHWVIGKMIMFNNVQELNFTLKDIKDCSIIKL